MAESRTEDRPCAECGRSFTPSRADDTYCRADCRVRAYRRRWAETTAHPPECPRTIDPDEPCECHWLVEGI
jgi:hypothetical protein